jgi:hypothetical protein
MVEEGRRQKAEGRSLAGTLSAFCLLPSDFLRQQGLSALVSRAGADVPRELLVDAMRIEARSAAMTAELGRVAAAFEAASIPLLAYKGPVVSQQLYGAPHLRAYSDLDVIVAPENAAAGEALLRTLGYDEAEPMTASQRRLHRRFAGETLFFRDAFLVDFHWRFSHPQFPLRLPFADAWARRQMVTIDSHTLATLGETDLVLVTASHAAKHLWHRAETELQLAALRDRPLDWAAIETAARRAGVWRQVQLSFFHVAPRPPARGRTDAGGRDLFQLLDRRRDALAALLLAAFVPTSADWRGSRLPLPLHWLLRPIRLIGKRLGLS